MRKAEEEYKKFRKQGFTHQEARELALKIVSFDEYRNTSPTTGGVR